MLKPTYDAIVVGSGFGGAVATCRLAQAGMQVAVLERGKRYGKGEFPRDWSNPLDGWLWQEGHGLMDVRTDNPMAIVQSAGYGGGSLIYANVHLRMPQDAFANAWPQGYTRGDLNPYYDLVAYMLDIKPISASQPRGLPPRSQQLASLATALKRQEQFRYLNLAVNFSDPDAPFTNKFGTAQGGCNHCGECDIGCNNHAKNSLDLNYLALAEKAGATAATQCEVFKIVPSSTGYCVHYIDHANQGAEHTVEAKAVFVCAGAINSTELLLRCRDEHRTLPNLSGALGMNYSGNGDYLGFAFDTQKAYEPYAGPTITTGIVYDQGEGDNRDWFIFEDGGYPGQIGRLLQLLNPDRSLASDGGIVLGEIEAEVARLGGKLTSLGTLERMANNSAVFLAMGRDRANGRISLRAGSNKLQIAWDVPSNLPLYSVEERFCTDVAKQLGGKFSPTPQWKMLHQPVSVHNLGGCVMAADAKDGVVDPHGEVFNHPNLFVLDGAALPAATGVNPSHTIAAVAERNIETFIRRRQQDKSWSAPERKLAVRIIDPLDDVVIPKGGVPVPLTPAINIAFTETMKGFCAEGPVDYEANSKRGKAQGRHAQFTLTITLPNIDRFLVDKSHAGIAQGRVVVDGLTPVEGAEVTAGIFNLFVPGDAPDRRRMLYALPFTGTDGKPYMLDGFKDVRDDGSFDVWKATSTLYTVIRAGHTHDGPVVLSGIIVIEKLDFLHQLTTIKATGGTLAAEADAMMRFGNMFAGTLWDVFVREPRSNTAG